MACLSRELLNGSYRLGLLSRTTLENFAGRALQLYEQEPSRLGEYVKRWSGWVRAGLTTASASCGSGTGLSVGCPIITLGVTLSLGVAVFVDGEVQKFHW